MDRLLELAASGKDPDRRDAVFRENPAVCQAHLIHYSADVERRPSATTVSPWFVAATVVVTAHGIAVLFFFVEWLVGASRLRQLRRESAGQPCRLILALPESGNNDRERSCMRRSRRDS